MKYRDYYQTLGVGRDASGDAIKQAYRRLARRFHPDVSDDPAAEERFKQVGEAYEVLKDPDKRAAYDRLGSGWRAGQEFEAPRGWGSGFDFRTSGTPGGDPFSEFFESLFGRTARRARRRMRTRGKDDHTRLGITLDEAYRGGERMVRLAGGETGRKLRVKIPPGVTAGQKIRLAGQGGEDGSGGPRGSLYLEIALDAHRWFRAEGKDVHLELPVAPWEAALGASVTVPTLGGAVVLEVPAGSQSGSRLRLRGRGLGGKEAGDQIVTLKIVNPPADSALARALYRRMSEALAFDPRGHLKD